MRLSAAPLYDNPLQLGLYLLAFSLEVGIVAEHVVNEAAFIGIERLGLHGASVRPYGAGKLAHAAEKGIFLHGAVMLHINNDPRGLGVGGLNHPVEQELEGVKDLSAPADQLFRGTGADVKQGMATSLLFLHGDKEPEVSEECLEDLSGCLVHRFRGGECGG